MHRHGYKGRKFGRETGERQALLRGLTCSLIEHHSITTTLIRAKEMRRSVEKLVTLAKKGDLASRRLLIARLDSISVANHLVDIVAPAIKRDSGYLRITPAGSRRGDNTAMATIAFVDPITATPAQKLVQVSEPTTPVKPTAKPKEETK